MNRINAFYDGLTRIVSELGGMHNAHLHLDRAGTLDDRYMQNSGHRILTNSHVSLHEKHALIHSIHDGPAYDADDLTQRVNDCIDIMTACHTRRGDTLVDVTADRVGLTALDTLLAIKQQRAGDIDLRIGAYSPLGFLDAEPQRWEIFEQGAERADFIAALPEADDTGEYPDHIGFEEHCVRTLDLAVRRGCMLHVHTDQRNDPREDGTERLIRVIRERGVPVDRKAEPWIWVVHMISPSTYEEERFQQLVANLRELNIGVICCPSAAVGMRQLRPITTPTYNSIPRVLELLAAGVHVRLASDNIADICSPSTTADLTDEVFMLSAAIRFYNIDILARLACGLNLDEAGRALIRDHLDKNDVEIDKTLAGH